MKTSEIARDLENYSVAVAPDQDTPEWWAGAPSVVRASDGTFYLAVRMREGDSPRGQRGYEIRILRSSDGIRFETIKQLRRTDAGVSGFERPALVIDPDTGRFRLYACSGMGEGWAILKFDDVDDPTQFDAGTVKVVLHGDKPEGTFACVRGYKDPFIFRDGGKWHMFVIGHDFVERIHHFVSDDGELWQRVPGTVLENSGWHNFYTRPACVLPLAVGYLFVYEGSTLGWLDPVYNIATGLAYSPDLKTFIDLTPNEPLLKTTTPGRYQTWRYSHWLSVGDKIHVYFEAARPNDTNETRVAVLDTLND